MKFLEKDLEEIIYTSSKESLMDRGLFIRGKLFRQMRIGQYGVCDLVSIQYPYYSTHFKEHHKGLITIYELKQDKIGVSTFFQCLNYARGIKHWIELHKEDWINHFNFKIVLIGNSFDNQSSFVYLPELFYNDNNDDLVGDENRTNIELMTYEYKIDGLYFKDLFGFARVNPGF